MIFRLKYQDHEIPFILNKEEINPQPEATLEATIVLTNQIIYDTI